MKSQIQPPSKSRQSTWKLSGGDVIISDLGVISSSARNVIRSGMWADLDEGGSSIWICTWMFRFCFYCTFSLFLHTMGKVHEEFSHAFWEKMQENHRRILWCNDCNGESPLRGPLDITLDPIGRRMVDTIAQANLLFLAHYDFPHCFRGPKAENLDLIWQQEHKNFHPKFPYDGSMRM